MKSKKSTKYYAVYFLDTNSKIVYDNWDECKNAIKGKKNRYKKFDSFKLAVEWLDSGTNYETNTQNQPLLQNAVYFDAGTGRNIGVEVRITDINKNSLLHFVLDKTKINQYGNYTLTNRTNNFGELSGLFFALKYAKEYNIKDICGDSNLVIKYWANGIYNKGNLDNDTIKLIEIVNKMYIEFKKNGGILHKISGDINPSDLGFHK